MLQKIYGAARLLTALMISASLVQLPYCASGEKDKLKSQVETINQKVEEWYQNELGSGRKVERARGFISEAQRQSQQQHWPRQMMKVLQVATGAPTSGAIDMDKVRRIVGGLQLNRYEEEMQFNVNLLRYYTQEFPLGDKLDRHEDLCGPFRQQGNGHFNFSAAIKNLLRITRENFINDDSFIKVVVDSEAAISPLYSATLICRHLDERKGIHLPGDYVKTAKYWPYAID